MIASNEHKYDEKPYHGGGVLMDVGSHRLDLLIHFFGLPEWVVGRTATLEIRMVDESAEARSAESGSALPDPSADSCGRIA